MESTQILAYETDYNVCFAASTQVTCLKVSFNYQTQMLGEEYMEREFFCQEIQSCSGFFYARLLVFQENHEIRHVRSLTLMRHLVQYRPTFHQNPANNRGWRCCGGHRRVTSVWLLQVPTQPRVLHTVTHITAVTARNRSKVEIFHHKQKLSV